jgi:hypothetical protein
MPSHQEARKQLQLHCCAIVLIWSATSSLWSYPHSLSYFNELAGGPLNGHRHLVDSSISIGQDLLFVKRWCDTHPTNKPLFVASSGLFDPRQLGIDFQPPPLGRPINARSTFPSDSPSGPLPGWYVIDVNYMSDSDSSMACGYEQYASTVDGARDLSYLRYVQPVARIGGSFAVFHISEGDAAELQTMQRAVARRRSDN